MIVFYHLNNNHNETAFTAGRSWWYDPVYFNRDTSAGIFVSDYVNPATAGVEVPEGVHTFGSTALSSMEYR